MNDNELCTYASNASFFFCCSKIYLTAPRLVLKWLKPIASLQEGPQSAGSLYGLINLTHYYSMIKCRMFLQMLLNCLPCLLFFLWYFSAEVCTGNRVTFTKGPNWALHIHLWGGPRQHSSTHQFTRSTEERRPKAVLCFPDVSRYGHIVILASPEVPVSWATEKNHFRITLFFRRLLVGHKNHDRTTFHRKQCASNFPSLLSMWAWLIA